MVWRDRARLSADGLSQLESDGSRPSAHDLSQRMNQVIASEAKQSP